MTVVAVDDTDSREAGLCTTYVAAEIADRLRAEGATVDRVLLVRLNPAIEHKTRGNAALAVHTSASPADGVRHAEDVLSRARTADPNTHPGLVVADDPPSSPEEPVAAFARAAMRDRRTLEDALALVEAQGYRERGWKSGRGRIGALAAVGAWAALEDWTYELIAYRQADRRGQPRNVDPASVFAAADRGYPATWDTVDTVERETVCVPHTPGPVLYGIRGEEPDAARSVADAIDSEPIERTQLFVTNQGTDAHLQAGSVGSLRDGESYRVSGTVSTPPETREGGHVFVRIADGDDSLSCVAFEPTKRFRERVRSLRVGEEVTVCGEVSGDALKLEKFALREPVETRRVTPTCPDCGRSMESAGADAGYRCRDCGTTAPGKVAQPIDRDLERGWYEVPPCARRHIAKPLVRGGFDAPTHPER